MLKERFVKDYFRQEGTVFNWWDPESGDMAHIYEREAQLVLTWLEDEGVENVLDVSCGRGRTLKRLPSTYRITGLDISNEMLRSVQSLNIASLDLVEGDAERLPFQAGSFGCVVCLKSLVHYPDPEQALREFNRVLRGEGILITDVDNSRSLRRTIKAGAHLINRYLDRDFQWAGEGIFRPFKERQFKEMLTGSGFEIEQLFFQGVLVPIGVPFPGGKKFHFINQDLSARLEGLDQVLEQTPGVQKLATYILAKCRKS